MLTKSQVSRAIVRQSITNEFCLFHTKKNAQPENTLLFLEVKMSTALMLVIFTSR